MAEYDTWDGMHSMITAHEDRLQRLESESTTGHEDRIQRLEEGFSDLAAAVAEQNATMRAFSHQMRTMTDSVCDKLEVMAERLSDKIGTINDSAREVAKAQGDQGARLAVLERQDGLAEKRFDWKMKIIYGLLTGAGGAAITLLSQYFGG